MNTFWKGYLPHRMRGNENTSKKGSGKARDWLLALWGLWWWCLWASIVYEFVKAWQILKGG